MAVLFGDFDRTSHDYRLLASERVLIFLTDLRLYITSLGYDVVFITF